ncbi:KPN_01571 family protein [Enterobacter hormaechei]
MNPYLWIFIVLLALDALREDLGKVRTSP